MKKLFIIVFGILTFTACKKENGAVVKVGEETEWSIPIAQVKDGGVGKDGIRAIESPTILEGSQATFLNDDELILGIKYNNTVIAYPHKILDYHEIVNHDIDDFAFSVSFCPLTGTGILYNRNIEDNVTSFGVSGLLFNSNLILYDRASDSYWPQMMLKSASGLHRDKENEFFQLIETTWGTWKKWYPESKVLGFDIANGVTPNYDLYPYGDYRTNNEFLLFSVPTKLKNLPQKERILGLRNNGEVSYTRFQMFTDANISFTSRDVAGETLLIFGSEEDNYMFAYKDQTEAGETVQVKKMLLSMEKGGLFEDAKGNKWDVFGNAYEGELKGEKLQVVENYIGYAFAWGAFYPDFFEVE